MRSYRCSLIARRVSVSGMIVLLAPLANCDSSTPAAVQPPSNVQKVGPGADCPAGGVVITTGLDKNGDGILNDAEVSQTATVCSGEDGAASLIRTESEPTGTSCVAGGQKISTGVDDGRNAGTAGNGLLEAGEVRAVQYVCNGKDGADAVAPPPALARTEPAASSAACPNGGFVLKVGIDDGQNGGTARDGQLQDGEVRSLEYICNGAVGASGASGSTALIEALA